MINSGLFWALYNYGVGLQGNSNLTLFSKPAPLLLIKDDKNVHCLFYYRKKQTNGDVFVTWYKPVWNGKKPRCVILRCLTIPDWFIPGNKNRDLYQVQKPRCEFDISLLKWYLYIKKNHQTAYYWLMLKTIINLAIPLTFTGGLLD